MRFVLVASLPIVVEVPPPESLVLVLTWPFAVPTAPMPVVFAPMLVGVRVEFVGFGLATFSVPFRAPVQLPIWRRPLPRPGQQDAL